MKMEMVFCEPDPLLVFEFEGGPEFDGGVTTSCAAGVLTVFVFVLVFVFVFVFVFESSPAGGVVCVTGGGGGACCCTGAGAPGIRLAALGMSSRPMVMPVAGSVA